MKKLTIFSIVFILVINSIISTGATNFDHSKSKISDEVWNSAVNEEGKRLVYISRVGVEDEKIENKFYETFGYSTKKYENELIYNEYTLPEIEKRVSEKYGKVFSKSKPLGNKIFDDNITILQYEEAEEYNQFILDKRKIISEEFTNDNKCFIDRNSLDNDSVLYEGIFTGSIIMYASDEEIKNISKDQSVVFIEPWEEVNIQKASSNAVPQIGADSLTGTSSTNYNYGNGFKGTGVKIGIIEVDREFDENCPQLSSKVGENLFYVENHYNDGTEVVPSGDKIHATRVTTIICGQKCVVNGEAYEGIVPNATVYVTSNNYENSDASTLLNAINMLVGTYGVSVINHSGGGYIGGYYASLDKEVDAICYQTNVTFVVAAGNIKLKNENVLHWGHAVSSPAKGYNVISVGNIVTTQSNHQPINGQYAVHQESFFEESQYMTNKPDLVAPGTNIYYVDSPGHLNNDPNASTGNSFSAPMVTGVVAQLHQAVPTLKSNPTRTKALILAGADPTLISTVGNDAVGSNGLVREKSGLGMLNAINSVNAALEGNYGSTTYNLRATSGNMQYYSGDAVQVGKQYLRAGEKVRVVLTFDKPETWLLVDENYNNNVDLFLYGPNGNIVSSSVTPVDSTGAPDVANNVEVLEFTATTAGEYIIKAKLITYNGAPGTITLNVAVAWTTTHNHIYSDHYVQRPMYPAHYAYCICGKCIEENHTFISGPVGTYCQKCSYIYSYN